MCRVSRRTEIRPAGVLELSNFTEGFEGSIDIGQCEFANGYVRLVGIHRRLGRRGGGGGALTRASWRKGKARFTRVAASYRWAGFIFAIDL